MSARQPTQLYKAFQISWPTNNQRSAAPGGFVHYYLSSLGPERAVTKISVGLGTEHGDVVGA